MQPSRMRPVHTHPQRARRAWGLDVLDRVQFAGRTLNIEYGKVIPAHVLRRQLLNGPGGTSRPPIEKRASLGIRLSHKRHPTDAGRAATGADRAHARSGI